MTWLLTATGAAIDLRFMPPAQISLLDIAHHLARLDRFAGACSRPYSVAEHSLLVCDILANELHVHSPQAQLAALLHDAHEAYCGDLTQPMKQLIGSAWRREEDRIAYAVRERFGVLAVCESHGSAIHDADMHALATERVQLMPPDPAGTAPWPVLSTHPPVNWINLADQAKFGWEDWRDAFLDRAAELRYAINLEAQAA